jgi:hypothetical protein
MRQTTPEKLSIVPENRLLHGWQTQDRLDQQPIRSLL